MFINYLQQILPYLEDINKKWFFTILILIFVYQSASFNMLKRNAKPITSKVLSDRLKTLESMGLVMKRVIVDKPLRVEYHLTKKGKDVANSFIKIFQSKSDKEFQ